MAIEPNIIASRSVSAEGLHGDAPPRCVFLSTDTIGASVPDFSSGTTVTYFNPPANPGNVPQLAGATSSTDGSIATLGVWLPTGQVPGTGVPLFYYEYVPIKPSSGATDSQTGKAYDANAGFYNPLAT
jgi:hypothetical protein